GSSVKTLRITNDTIEFLDGQGEQVQVNFAPDINKELIEGDRIHLFIEDLHRIGNPMTEIEKVDGKNWSQQMDHLGEKLATYNWNAYAKEEIRDRFTSSRFKNALKVAYLISTENINILLEEAQKGSQEEIEQMLDLD
ncbi:18950_t:CDS:2, partial [Racocetra persica]